MLPLSDLKSVQITNPKTETERQTMTERDSEKRGLPEEGGRKKKRERNTAAETKKESTQISSGLTSFSFFLTL